MTHRAELLTLQDKARRAGRVCDFTHDAERRIDSIFYADPEASPLSRLRAGYSMGPLTFAEKERAALADWQQTDPARLSRVRMGLERKPRRFVS